MVPISESYNMEGRTDREQAVFRVSSDSLCRPRPLCFRRGASRKKRGWEEGATVDELWADLEKTVSAATILGYLNFSDGRSDVRWQKQLHDAYTFSSVATFLGRGRPCATG